MSITTEPALTVNQALMLPAFSRAKIVAGEAGLERIITTAMVLEAPDIESWGKSGMLILTSYFALKDMVKSEVSKFFKSLSEIGISGVVFKVDRLVDKLPPDVLALCNKYAIPLIKIDKTTTYEPILLDIMGRIINANAALLNHFFEVYKTSMALSLKQPNKHDILVKLKQVTGADSAFLDKSRQRKISTNGRLSSFESFELEPIEGDTYTIHDYFNARLKHSDFSAEATAVSVPASDGCEYYLLIFKTIWQLSPMDIMAIENIVSLLQIEILTKAAVDHELFMHNNDIVHDLLLDRYASTSKIDEALRALRFDAKPNYQLLLVSFSLDVGTNSSNQLDIQRAIIRTIQGRWPDTVYFMRNDRLVFLNNYEMDREKFNSEVVQALMEELHELAELPNFKHMAAISRPCGRYDIANRNKEVVDIYKLLDNSKWKNRCISHKNLGIYKIFLEIENPDEVISYLDPRVLELRELNRDLFATMLAFVDAHMNYANCAKALFVNAKTIRYRLSRIKELVGLDLNDPDDYLQVAIAEKIFELTGDI